MRWDSSWRSGGRWACETGQGSLWHAPPFAKAYDDGVGRSLATRAILSPPWHGVNVFVPKEGITSAERVMD